MNYGDNSYIVEFGEYIKRLRERRGWSLADFADKIWEVTGEPIDRNSIYRIENGRVNCTILTLKLLAEGLGKHPSELLKFYKRIR